MFTKAVCHFTTSLNPGITTDTHSIKGYHIVYLNTEMTPQNSQTLCGENKCSLTSLAMLVTSFSCSI